MAFCSPTHKKVVPGSGWYISKYRCPLIYPILGPPIFKSNLHSGFSHIHAAYKCLSCGHIQVLSVFKCAFQLLQLCRPELTALDSWLPVLGLWSCHSHHMSHLSLLLPGPLVTPATLMVPVDLVVPMDFMVYVVHGHCHFPGCLHCQCHFHSPCHLHGSCLP